MKWELTKNKHIPFFTTGSLQLYHIVDDIIQQTGKADFFISSFTVSEEFIRKLHRLKKSNMIGNLTMLIDIRNANKAFQLTWFLHNIADSVYLANNHSKLLLIQNDSHKISVVTSQNQTRGNRFECGMISTVHSDYDFFKKEINQVLNKCIKFNGNFDGSISQD